MEFNIEIFPHHLLLGFSLMEFETEIGENGHLISIGIIFITFNLFIF